MSRASDTRSIIQVAEEIRDSNVYFDHRPYLPSGVAERYFTAEFLAGYTCFKATVADVLKPETIVEIGVGLGISAMAFLYSCPKAAYIGIDNDHEANHDFPVVPSEFVGNLLGTRGRIWKTDSTTLDRLPPADLVHIDGDHSYDAAYSDVMLAWRSDARWILVDDARDSVVAAATFDALRRKSPGSVDWAYFEDTYTGSILISRVKERA